jgi:hypothetical protein
MPIQSVRSLVESRGVGMCRCSCATFAKPSYSWAIRSIIPLASGSCILAPGVCGWIATALLPPFPAPRPASLTPCKPCFANRGCVTYKEILS